MNGNVKKTGNEETARNNPRRYEVRTMTIEQLRSTHQANPFQPFTIRLADGRSLHVPHRDFLSHSPSGRTVIVYHEDESFSIIDLLLVTELEVSDGKGRRPRRR